MITLKNRQRKIKIDTARIIKEVQHILEILKYADFDIGIWITTNKTIRFYNKTYRHKDKPTDVLSFPYYPELKAGERIKPHCDDDKNLGDLILSAEYIVQEAKKHKVTFEARLCLLLVHGICHLLGYDHIQDADFRRMRTKEAFILKKLAP
ncbi:MAG: rRNA maturation RNase YbeY [Candidatus Babeliaceae bacterium]